MIDLVVGELGNVVIYNTQNQTEEYPFYYQFYHCFTTFLIDFSPFIMPANTSRPPRAINSNRSLVFISISPLHLEIVGKKPCICLSNLVVLSSYKRHTRLAMKGKILSIRIGEDLHQKAIKVSTQQGQKLSEFIRNTIDHACNTASYETSYETEQNQSATEAIQSELNIKNQQIERLQSALDQSQQLQALAESRHQAEHQQLSEIKSRSVLQRLRAVFVSD